MNIKEMQEKFNQTNHAAALSFFGNSEMADAYIAGALEALELRLQKGDAAWRVMHSRYRIYVSVYTNNKEAAFDSLAGAEAAFFAALAAWQVEEIPVTAKTLEIAKKAYDFVEEHVSAKRRKAIRKTHKLRWNDDCRVYVCEFERPDNSALPFHLPQTEWRRVH